MPEILEAPSVKNFIKGNMALGPLETSVAGSPATAAPPAAPAAPAPEPVKVAEPAKATPEPSASPVVGADDGYDFEKPDRAKPPKNKKHWDGFLDANERRKHQFEQEKTALKTELDLVKQQIEEAKKLASTPRNDAELEALKKDKAELDAKLYAVARERHPKFIEKYDGKVGEQISDVKILVSGEIGARIVELLDSPESESRTSALKEALSEVDDLDRSAVRTAWLNIDKLKRQRSAELNTSKEEFEAMKIDHETKTKAQSEQQAKDNRAMADKLYRSGLETLSKKLPEISSRKDDKSWNDGLQERLGMAEKIIHGEAPPERVVEAVLRDAAFPAVQAERDSYKEQVEKLTAQVESLIGANPALKQPSSKIPGVPERGRFDPSTSPGQAFKNYAAGIRADTTE